MVIFSFRRSTCFSSFFTICLHFPVSLLVPRAARYSVAPCPVPRAPYPASRAPFLVLLALHPVSRTTYPCVPTPPLREVPPPTLLVPPQRVEVNRATRNSQLANAFHLCPVYTSIRIIVDGLLNRFYLLRERPLISRRSLITSHGKRTFLCSRDLFLRSSYLLILFSLFFSLSPFEVLGCSPFQYSTRK